MNTVHFGGTKMQCCDKELEAWADSFARQLMEGKSKFTREEETLILKHIKDTHPL